MSTLSSVLPPQKLADTAYEGVLSSIAIGTFGSNNRLTEIQLCELLSMSRTPVREAINRLVAEQVLTGVPHSGVRVRVLTDDDLLRQFDIQEALLVHAARAASRQVSTQGVGLLRAACSQMNSLPLSANSLAEVSRSHRELEVTFFRQLAAIGGIGELIHLIDQQFSYLEILWPTHWSSLPIFYPFLNLPPVSDLYHQLVDVVEKAVEDDAGEAARTLINHLRRKFQSLMTVRLAMHQDIG